MIDVVPYLHVPFEDRGRDWSGCDCWGLARLVARFDFNRDFPAHDGSYESADDGEGVGAVIDEERACWQEIPAGLEVPGDVVTLVVRGAEAHVGTVIEPGMMLHTMKRTGPVVESYRRNPWKKRVRGFYRWIR